MTMTPTWPWHAPKEKADVSDERLVAEHVREMDRMPAVAAIHPFAMNKQWGHLEDGQGTPHELPSTWGVPRLGAP